VLVPVCGALVFAVCGCSKRTDLKARTSALEKAFPGAAQAGQGTVPGEPAAADANAFVQTALAAVRTNDYAASVVALDSVAQTRNVTPEQLMAVQNAKQAMVKDLVDRAANGDAKAIAALAAIERTRSQ
jgi:hypothetical protein